jgi:hypothetical protein
MRGYHQDTLDPDGAAKGPFLEARLLPCLLLMMQHHNAKRKKEPVGRDAGAGVLNGNLAGEVRSLCWARGDVAEVGIFSVLTSFASFLVDDVLSGTGRLRYRACGGISEVYPLLHDVMMGRLMIH